MGGIAGVFHCGTIKPVDASRIERMCDVLAHRGPDGAGVWTGPGVGLGCRWLAISHQDGCAQPLQSADGRAVIVFDGAIHNFRALRRELEGLGRTFQTQGEAEVLLEAYLHRGPDCLQHLTGTFAVAIYHTVDRTLFLARDRFGAKPLFTAMLSDGSLAFASELKGLLAHPLLRREADYLAVEDYMTWGFMPDHRCLLRGVEKLAPAHFRLLEHDTPPAPPVRYWDLSFASRHAGKARDLEAQLLHRLREAVGSALVADVPKAALLTGDMESSSITALMAEAIGGGLRSFSAGFEGEGVAPQAQAVADILGTDHAHRRLGDDEFGAIERIASMFDEPFADPAAIVSWRWSQLARESAQVVLCAAGAQEVLAGHRHYQSFHREEQLRRFVPAKLREKIPGSSGLGGTAAQRLVHSVALQDESQRFAIYDQDMARLIGNYRGETRLITAMEGAPARSALDAAQYAELAFLLPAGRLTMLDRTGMAAGLEVRSAMLDHRLVEFCAALPEALRIKGMQGMYLMRKAMGRYLSDEVLARPTSRPVVPVADWLRGPLQRQVRSLARSSALARTGWFDARQLERMVQAHDEGRADHSRILWQLLMLDRSLARLGMTG